MKSVALLFAFITFLGFSSCNSIIKGEGEVVAKEHPAAGFNAMEVGDIFRVQLIDDNKETVEVRAEENLHEHIVAEVKDGVLHIHSGSKNLSSENLLVTVHYSTLQKLEVSGAARIETLNPIENSDLEIEVTGAADMRMDMDVYSLSIGVSGGSEMLLSGKAENVEIDITGAGKINASELRSKNCVLSVAGAGEAIVDVSKTLDVKITGSGNVKYRGNPEISQSITGAGEISKL